MKWKSNLDKYILWTDSVHLISVSCLIRGPLNFDSRSDIISNKKIIKLSHWEFLLTSCNVLGILPLHYFQPR